MEQIDNLTDEEVSLLCRTDDDMELAARGGRNEGFSYQEKFIECWEIQGLKLEQIRQKWELERGKWPVPDQPWNEEVEQIYLNKKQRNAIT